MWDHGLLTMVGPLLQRWRCDIPRRSGTTRPSQQRGPTERSPRWLHSTCRGHEMHGIKRRLAGTLLVLPVIAGSLLVGGTAAQAITGGKSIAADAFPYAAHIQVHTIVWNGLKSQNYDNVCGG